MPMGAWESIVEGHYEGLHNDPNYTEEEILTLPEVLAAVGTWRYTQGIYRFDPTVYEEVIATGLHMDEILPHDVLLRPPEYCVYIETPGLFFRKRYLDAPEQFHMYFIHGVYVHLDRDAERRDYIRFLFDIEDSIHSEEKRPQADSIFLPFAIHLGPWTLDRGIKSWCEDFDFWRYEGWEDELYILASMAIPRVLNLYLYICSETCDYKGDETPRRSRATKTKHGPKYFPPPAPRTWDVGFRMGAALRIARSTSPQLDAEQDSSRHRTSPRPHVRRAHWHAFRYGKGRGEVQLRWLPPIPVNFEYSGTIPTIRPVK